MPEDAARKRSRSRRSGRREKIAHHEAGHAVIARTFGRAVHRVSLARLDSYEGHVVFAMPRSEERALRRGKAPWWRVQQEVMIALAGAAAEALFAGRLNRRAAAADIQQAYELGAYVTFGEDETFALLEWLYVRVRTMLALPRCWAKVVHVARALLEREVLTGRDVDALMGRRT